MRASIIWAAAAVLAAAGPSLAQSSSQSAVRNACQADYQANCASVPPGGQASLQCLQQHMINLSPNCQAAVKSASAGGSGKPNAALPPASASPQAPVAKAPPPPMMSPRQEAMIMRQACGTDFRTYCHGVPMGEGRGMACLRGNADRLSASCKQALAAEQGR